MISSSIPRPTEAELEILAILWENGPSTVRYVNEILNEKKKVGYTTTLKIMQLMVEKKILDRDETERSHRYRPAVKEADTQSVLIDKLLETAFGGSAMRLVMQVLGNHKASQKEISMIREYLDGLDQEKKEK